MRSGAQTSVVTIYLIIVLCKFAKVMVATGLSAVGSHTHTYHTIRECAALRGQDIETQMVGKAKHGRLYVKEGEKRLPWSEWGFAAEQDSQRISPPPFARLYANANAGSQDWEPGARIEKMAVKLKVGQQNSR
ncbi:hypothetical protein PG987_014333 [Apiospora arundinis]